MPSPIDLGREMPQVLATGGELKTTFCLAKGRYAILSQHIGDMENKEAISQTTGQLPLPNSSSLITHHSSLFQSSIITPILPVVWQNMV